MICFICVLVAVTISVMMALSATAATSISTSDSPWSMAVRHLIWVAVGLVLLVVMVRVDYHRWQRLSSMAISLAFGAVLLTALPAFGLTANGAQRWINIGPFVLQPSEPAKLAFVLFLADILSRQDGPVRGNRPTLRAVVTVSLVMIGLLMMQPHLGASLMIVAIAGVVLIYNNTRFSILVLGTVLCTASAWLVIAATPWRWERMLGFMAPWDDPLGSGYQPLQALHALASGGIDGVGIGAGRAKWGFLPYAHTDFIFAVIGEELGLLGTIPVICLFGTIAAAGIYIVKRAPDSFGRLLAAGVTAWMSIQAAMNIATVLGIFPVVGMTLPLLSFGGSSLVSSLAAMGLLLNVARQTR